MSDENKSARAVQFWLGMFISTALVLWLVLSVDWSDVSEQFVAVRYWLLMPLVASFVLHFMLRAWRWRLLLGEDYDSRTPFSVLYDALMVGNLATFVLPLRMGEFVRPYMLSRCSDSSFATGFASVVLERFFDLSSVLLSFGLLLGFLGSSSTIDPLVYDAALALSALAIAILIFIVVAVYLPDLLLKVVGAVLGLFPTKLSKPLTEFLTDFLAAARVLRDFRVLLSILGSTFLVWASCYLRFWLALLAFPSIDASLMLSVGTAVMVSLAIAAPSAPGFVGIYEAGCVGAFALFGIGSGPATAYAIATHVLEYLLIGASGTIALARNDLRLNDLTTRAAVG